MVSSVHQSAIVVCENVPKGVSACISADFDEPAPCLLESQTKKDPKDSWILNFKSGPL